MNSRQTDRSLPRGRCQTGGIFKGVICPIWITRARHRRFLFYFTSWAGGGKTCNSTPLRAALIIYQFRPNWLIDDETLIVPSFCCVSRPLPPHVSSSSQPSAPLLLLLLLLLLLPSQCSCQTEAPSLKTTTWFSETCPALFCFIYVNNWLC